MSTCYFIYQSKKSAGTYYGSCCSANDIEIFNKTVAAELESCIRSVRSKQRIHEAKQNGGYVGRAPFGKQVVKGNGIRVLVDNSDYHKLLQNINVLLKRSFSAANIAYKLTMPVSLVKKYIKCISLSHVNSEEAALSASNI
jgi:DNA invertase Pin-like site-specific DNA recombinase